MLIGPWDPSSLAHNCGSSDEKVSSSTVCKLKSSLSGDPVKSRFSETMKCN